MKNKYIYIGIGAVVLGVAAFFLLRKKKSADDAEGSTKSAEATDEVSDEEIAEVETDAKEAESVTNELAEVEALPESPEKEVRRKTLRDRLEKLKGRLGRNRAGRLALAIGGGAVRNVGSAVSQIKENRATRRKCNKEADQAFGFPIRPQKIKQKREFIRACKNQGGEDFAFSFNEETYDLFS